MDFPIKSITDLEKLSYRVKWQYFERLVAFVFEQNGFAAEQNVVIRYLDTKRQYDVVAKRFSETYVVECKKWRRAGSAAVRAAVAKHTERCELFALMDDKSKIIPVIVTLEDTDTDAADGVAVVPIMKLNAFLNNQ